MFINYEQKYALGKTFKAGGWQI